MSRTSPFVDETVTVMVGQYAEQGVWSFDDCIQALAVCGLYDLPLKNIEISATTMGWTLTEAAVRAASGLGAKV